MLESIREIIRSGLTGVGFIAITGLVIWEVLNGKDIGILKVYLSMVGMMVGFWFRGQISNNH